MLKEKNRFGNTFVTCTAGGRLFSKYKKPFLKWVRRRINVPKQNGKEQEQVSHRGACRYMNRCSVSLVSKEKPKKRKRRKKIPHCQRYGEVLRHCVAEADTNL